MATRSSMSSIPDDTVALLANKMMQNINYLCWNITAKLVSLVSSQIYAKLIELDVGRGRPEYPV